MPGVLSAQHTDYFVPQQQQQQRTEFGMQHAWELLSRYARSLSLSRAHSLCYSLPAGLADATIATHYNSCYPLPSTAEQLMAWPWRVARVRDVRLLTIHISGSTQPKKVVCGSWVYYPIHRDILYKWFSAYIHLQYMFVSARFEHGTSMTHTY